MRLNFTKWPFLVTKRWQTFVCMMMLSTQLLAQDKIVAGTVTSESDNEPIPGVNVLVKGTTTGTITNVDGKYSISVPSAEAVLLFTFVGMDEKSIVVGNQSTINMGLVENVTSLSEVVITGYGQQLKTDLTGNIAKVSGKDIENLPVTNVEQALQGRAAGVVVGSANGKLGQSIRMRIRGSSSVTADNQPLFVIDGIPVTTQNSGFEDEAPTNPLSDLNFNDVESIDILKDASAAAIYGSRAANGVVIITTKKGKSGKTQFNLNYQGGFSNPTNKRDWLNAEQYVNYALESAANSDRLDGVSVDDPDSWTVYVTDELEGLSLGTDWRSGAVDTDWEELFYNKNAPQHRVDMNASGGTDKTRFYVSGSLLDQEGITIGNAIQRISGRVNLDHQTSDKFGFGVNMSLARTSNDRVSDDNAFSTPGQMVAQVPISPVRTEDGELNRNTLYYNGLLDLDGVSREDITFRNLSNFYANYQVAPSLNIRGEFGIDLLNQNQDRFYASYTDGGNGSRGFGQSRWVRVFNYTSKLFGQYNKQIGTLHNIDVTGGVEFQESRTDVSRTEGQEFPVDDLKKLISSAKITLGESTLDQFAFLSYFARVNYKFDNKYLLTVSTRADGSSRFGANNRFGFFPAASLGWILTEEDFLQDNSVLSFLKLRGSYGITGNAQIGNFQQLGLYGAAGYAGVSGLQPTQIPNEDLSWEKTSQTDIGIDFGLFNDRITGEVDYYVKNTTDLLLDVPVPGTSGYRIQTRNIGSLENKGVEFVLNANILTGPLTWTTNFNIAFNDNKITDLGNQDIIDDGASRYMNVAKVGQPLSVFYGAEYAGVDPQNGDALYYINDPENNNRETTNDFNEANFIVLGNPNPDYTGGFNNTFSWKGLDLNVFFQFVQGNQVHNAGARFQFAGDWFDNQQIDQIRSWQNPGDITDVPEARFGSTNGGAGRSSRYLYDASYVRLKNITLGYNLPADLLDRTFLRTARVYVTGVNLLTFTDYPGWDPEVSTDFLLSDSGTGRPTNIYQGVDFYSPPQPKTFTVGINLGF